MTAITCSEATYTTPEGLQFALYCNEDQTGLGDLSNVGTDTVDECMEQCAQRAGGGCGAAAFDTSEHRCFLKNNTITHEGATDRDGWILGVANSTQLEPLPSGCSNNGGNETTQNGLPFTIYCDQDLVGSDVSTGSSYRKNSETLEDCMDHCSTMHPLCTGVAWDASLELGWLNCYPKNATSETWDAKRAQGHQGVHIAKATLQVSTDDCRAVPNGKATANNTEVFTLACDQNLPGNNLTVQHSDSYQTCIDICATHPETDCLAVIFDQTMAQGYENCYLKSAIGSPTPNQAGFTFATRQQASNTANPNHDNNGGGSKAWIAGPVIGGIVAFAIVLAGLWWWQRRRRGTRAATQNAQMAQPPIESEKWARDESGMTPDLGPPSEMGPEPNYAREETQELDSTPKVELESHPGRR
jgi:hypothetical protein